MRRLFMMMVLVFASVGPLAAKEKTMKLTPEWEFVSDRVMGGVSDGEVTWPREDAADVARLTGDVSLENNGGFVQMAFDLKPDGSGFDASEWQGIILEVKGNGENYQIRLRTDDLNRPWQSYLTTFETTDDWQRLTLRFDRFEPHRTEQPFDPGGLRRIGVIAIGREFSADVSVRGLAFYR